MRGLVRGLVRCWWPVGARAGGQLVREGWPAWLLCQVRVLGAAVRGSMLGSVGRVSE